MLYENLNEKYYTLKPQSNHNGLFSSFRIFKTIIRPTRTIAIRPPYPIVINDPLFSEVFYNMNKSDALLGLTLVLSGFLGTIFITRRVTTLSIKFGMTKVIMISYGLFGLFMAMNCSYFRLIGQLDNGLRWRNKEMVLSKYDFTSDFEKNTIFKNFRTRID
jgi:hypothetical protein